MKPKTIIINGKPLTVNEAKRRRDQLARGFAIGAFEKERHAEHWKEFEVIREELRRNNVY